MVSKSTATRKTQGRVAPKLKTLALTALFGAAALGMSAGAAQATVILDVDLTGQLNGAQGVDIGGTLYDVEFLDGSCVDVFSGCDSLTDFAFTDFATADLAAKALLAQVFLDVALGDFDTDYGLTRGCATNSNNYCMTFIPYEFILNGALVGGTLAQNGSVTDGPGSFSTGITTDLSSFSYYTWARFSLAEAGGREQIPEPATLGIFGLGLAGLGALGRRRRRSA